MLPRPPLAPIRAELAGSPQPRPGQQSWGSQDPGRCFRMFHAPASGAVLMATWENDKAVTAWRARRLARQIDGGDYPDAPAHAALGGVHLLEMQAPLFGPEPDSGSYNRRPHPAGRLP